MGGRAHLLLYDGECGLCDRLTQFVLKRDRHDRFRFAPLQSRVGRAWVQRFGRDSDDLDTFYVVAHYEDERKRRLLSRSDAGLFVLDELGGGWKAAKALRVFPRRLRDWGYDRIANNRHRLFGKHDACLLPAPGVRWKFLEAD